MLFFKITVTTTTTAAAAAAAANSKHLLSPYYVPSSVLGTVIDFNN